ncbi:hypothetical protein [Streptomyces sp. NPDC005131]
MSAMTMAEATEFLKGIEAGSRASLLDPRAVNHPGTWSAEFVLLGEQQTLPYTPLCRDSSHTRIYMRVWEHTGYVSNLCACELAAGNKRLAVWQMPDDATHSMSATGFDDRETGRRWRSTQCGVLIETTDGVHPSAYGHQAYVVPGMVRDSLTCPGCRLRNGVGPESCPGVLHLT